MVTGTTPIHTGTPVIGGVHIGTTVNFVFALRRLAPRRREILSLDKSMRTILLGLCALTLFAGLTQKTAAQTVTAALGPPTVDADWVWSDEYQCWLWNGPEFQGDYQGHSFFKEHFLNHEFFNFFDNTPAAFWLPLPSIQLNGIAGESWSAEEPSV